MKEKKEKEIKKTKYISNIGNVKIKTNDKFILLSSEPFELENVSKEVIDNLIKENKIKEE